MHNRTPATSFTPEERPHGLLARACACGNHTLEAECAYCKGEKGLEDKGAGVKARSFSLPPYPLVSVSTSLGHSLDEGTRAFMEPRFQAELSRVHARPTGGVQASRLGVSQPEDPAELEAEATARRVTQAPAAEQAPVGFSQARARGGALPEANFSKVRVHTGAQAAAAARAVGAQAYTTGEHIIFGAGQYAPHTPEGQRLLAHELVHVQQQRRGLAPGFIQRRIAPEDVSVEMVGQWMQVTDKFTAGVVTVQPGETVEVVSWSNASKTARVKLPIPHLNAGVPFDVPKRLLRPAPTLVPGIAPYGAGIGQVVKGIEKGEAAIAKETSRKGGPRPGEIPRLEGLQANRERLLNRRLIQATMFNRFDPLIKKWVDFYNLQSGFTGKKALDPNLVKSMLFQESQMGTSGEHLEDPASWEVRARFNIGQVIDSAAAALLIMMTEMDPALITKYHLQDIQKDRAQAQKDLSELSKLKKRTPTQQARLDDLIKIRDQSKDWGLSFSETFMWMYRAPGETKGFDEAIHEFFTSVGAGVPARNLDYDFWIRTAVRWLFEKRKSVKSWEEAIRAYNGSGQGAKDYKKAVVGRAGKAAAAQKKGDEFLPEKI